MYVSCFRFLLYFLVFKRDVYMSTSSREPFVVVETRRDVLCIVRSNQAVSPDSIKVICICISLAYSCIRTGLCSAYGLEYPLEEYPCPVLYHVCEGEVTLIQL